MQYLRFDEDDALLLPEEVEVTDDFTVMVVDRYWGPQRGRTLNSGERDPNFVLGKHGGGSGCYIDHRWVGHRPDEQSDRFTVKTALRRRKHVTFTLDGEVLGTDSDSTLQPGRLAIGPVAWPAEGSQADVAAGVVWRRALSDAEREAAERTLMATFTRSPRVEGRTHVAVLDIALGRDGRLAELPNLLDLPALVAPVDWQADQASATETRAQIEARLPGMRGDVVQLTADIAQLEGDIGRRAALEAELAGKTKAREEEESLARELRGRGATFYTGAKYAGESLTLTPTDEGPAEEDNLCPRGGKPDHFLENNVESIEIDEGIVVLLGEHPEFGPTSNHNATFVESLETLGRWANRSSSLRASRTDSLKTRIANADKAKETAKAEQAELERRIDGLKDRDERLRTARARRAQLEASIATDEEHLEQLDRAVIGAASPQVMPVVAIDRLGMTTSGAVLGFAWTKDAPTLHVAADARVHLYFRGADEQLYALGYDTRTSRASVSLPPGGSSVLATARGAGAWFEGLSVNITAAESGDADRCDVTISCTQPGAKEHWPDVPRQASLFEATLRGRAARGVDVVVGRTSEPLRGSFTEIPLAAALGRAVPAGADVRVVPVTTRTTSVAVKGARVLSVAPTELALDAPARVTWVFRYPIENVQSDDPRGLAAQGSRLVVIDADPLAAPLANLSATATATAQVCRWMPDSPGRAVSFRDRQVLAVDPARLRERSVRPPSFTLEAWVRPRLQNGAGTILAMHDGHGPRMLGLEGSETAASLLGTPLQSTTLPRPLTGDLTVELWIRPDQYGGTLAQGSGEAFDLTLETDGRIGYRHAGMEAAIRSQAAVPVMTWSHVAVTRDVGTRRVRIHIDGRLDLDEALPLGPVAGGNDIHVAKDFKGGLDELRVWDRVRQPNELRAQSQVRASGREPKLLSCWRVRVQDLVDHAMGATTQSPGRGVALIPGPVASLRLVGVGGHAGRRSVGALSPNRWHHVSAAFTQSWALELTGAGWLDAGDDDALDQTGDLTLEVIAALDGQPQAHGLMAMGAPLPDSGDGSARGVPYDLSASAEGELVFAFESPSEGVVRVASPAGAVP